MRQIICFFSFFRPRSGAAPPGRPRAWTSPHKAAPLSSSSWAYVFSWPWTSASSKNRLLKVTWAEMAARARF